MGLECQDISALSLFQVILLPVTTVFDGKLTFQNINRKPPSHPDVRRALENLFTCVQWMPYNGALFTAQAPFFCVFMMSLVAYTEEDRSTATNWFNEVLAEANCRSVSIFATPIIPYIYSLQLSRLVNSHVFEQDRLYSEGRTSMILQWYFTDAMLQSVPPVWKAVQTIWEWMDAEIVDHVFSESTPIEDRRAWWEEMVEHIVETIGWISLT